MRGSPPRDRRDDGHLVAVLHGRRETAAEAYVLVVQVEVDEGIGFALLISEPGREGGVAGGHIGHGLAQRPAGRLDRAGAPSVGGEHRGQVQRNGHVRSSSTRVVTSRSRAAITGASGSALPTASSVFRPWPVTHRTTSSSGPSRPSRASARAAAAVTPPAVSAKTPASCASKPPAIGATTALGKRQPSCSAIS